jgi:hypothetical protein
MRQWIEHFFGERVILVGVDSAVEEDHELPYIIDGYVPDVIYRFKSNGRRIVGEAETRRILNEPYALHAEQQIKAFMNYCMVNKHYLVVTVPLLVRAYTTNMLNRIKDECGKGALKLHIPLIHV